MRRQAFLAISLAGFLSACSSPPAKHFDSQQWKSGNPSSRGAMVQDLIDRKILLEKAPSDVRALLGRLRSLAQSELTKGKSVRQCRHRYDTHADAATGRP